MALAAICMRACKVIFLLFFFQQYMYPGCGETKSIWHRCQNPDRIGLTRLPSKPNFPQDTS